MELSLRIPISELPIWDKETLSFCGREGCVCDHLTTNHPYNDELRCSSPHSHDLNWQITVFRDNKCRYARADGILGEMTREGFQPASGK